MQKILIIEDDLDLNSTIVKFLQIHSFECYSAYDGEDAINQIYEKHFELILLDVKLPSLNGFEVAKRIREFSTVPIIFLTSLESEKNIEKGFLNGGDDYITKPFSLKELKLRIIAILRRVYKNQHIIHITDSISFNTQSLQLSQDNKVIHLTSKEISLLSIFLQNRDKVFTKREIFEILYNYEQEPNEASLRVFINKIRNTIGKEKIETIKNVGYRYVG